MTTTDYIINAILILLVVRQVRGQRLDLFGLLLPLVLVLVAGQHFLHTIPTAGNDLVLIIGLATAGAILGLMSGLATHMRLGTDRVALARAGWIAGGLWVLGVGTRMGFAFASSHGLGPAIQHFSIANQITSADAWTAALVLMALSEVTARIVTLNIRSVRMGGVIPSRLQAAAAAASRI
jgi:hypothetical protein